MKRIIILGTTGSIGKNTLDIVRSDREEFSIAGLSAHTNETELLKTAEEFGISGSLALTGKETSDQKIGYTGREGLLRMIRETDADIVVNGIAGSSGLMPSVAALENGKHLALANKETIVMAGSLIKKLASEKNLLILPVDSEHSAVFNLLRGRNPKEIAQIILTASGGPFREKPIEEFGRITLEETLKHPTWAMGMKISIDSATMANKGLEVIEANELFDMEGSRIKVLIHPQSMVHSLIRTADGEMYAQISEPDMRMPIQNALTYPEIRHNPYGFLDLADRTLNFYAPDMEKFPMLALAYEVLKLGGGYKIAYNAANEIAVKAFTEGSIGFTDIHRIVEKTLNLDWGDTPGNFESVLETDKKVREAASEMTGDIT